MTTPNRIVCIVTDELDIVCLFRDALKDLPRTSVFTFTDPVSALDHFKINKSIYAVIVSDYKVPGMKGIQLIKQVRDLDYFVRTILLTGVETDDKFQEYTATNIINGFLQKPVPLEDLRNEVNTQLHYREMALLQDKLKIVAS